MLAALPVLLSVILVLALGQLLSRTILKEASFWQGMSKLSYWVLFPALLFKTVSQSDFTGMQIDAVVIAMLVGLFGVFVISWIIGAQAKLSNADLSSVLQGSFRHNGFMALAIIAGLYGEAGVEIGTLCIAILVPPSNVLSVCVLIYLNKRNDKVNTGQLLAKEIARNPLILAILAGVIAKYMPLPTPAFLLETTGLLGRGALPALLLAVGAGVQFTSSIKGTVIPLGIALLAKTLIFPAIMVTTAMYFGISGLTLNIIAIFGVMPTAISSYALARELDGNASLMAEIISFQTLLSLPIMLIWLSLLP